MQNLTQEELLNVEGGAWKIAIGKWMIIGGITTFIIGAINGYLRPLSCSSEK